MKLTIINGSPRGKKSNSTLLLTAFTEGFTEVPGNSVEVHYLALKDGLMSATDAFSRSEAVLLAFPLYSDAMPSIVKSFIESLEPHQGKEGNPAMTFLIQCGFPEALHLRTLERYLLRLAQRLGARHLGTMLRGGVEGIRYMPPRMTRGLFGEMRQFGRELGTKGVLDGQRLRKFSGRERFSGVAQVILRLVVVSGVVNSFWNKQLKRHGAHGERMNAPYARSQ